MRLQDKVAVITGGGTGIGKAITLGFAKEGAHVVLAARDLPRLQKVSEEVKALGRESLAVKMDVLNSKEAGGMVEKTVEKFGKVDILVNNAAIYPATPFLEMSEEEWIKVIDVNLNGVFRCTQAVAKEMAKQKSGRIINISSGQGLLGIPLMAHYTATKGALIAFTRAIAAELGPLGINVNCIAGGLFFTDTVKNLLPPEFFDNFAKSMALRRIGEPEDWVGTALLLASAEGSYITGETISVDGGYANVMAQTF
jgi:NAD(P)-dependent dehydrogenase (short-subunit alcohol dehydrogenase family)